MKMIQVLPSYYTTYKYSVVKPPHGFFSHPRWPVWGGFGYSMAKMGGSTSSNDQNGNGWPLLAKMGWPVTSWIFLIFFFRTRDIFIRWHMWRRLTKPNGGIKLVFSYRLGTIYYCFWNQGENKIKNCKPKYKKKLLTLGELMS